VLVELGVAEQRYRAVLEVLDDGASVTDVARRYGVARQTVHGWLRRYVSQGGLAGLVDRSSRPESCPHQMSAVIEAQVVRLRREHPSWGPSRMVWQLERAGVSRVPVERPAYLAAATGGRCWAASPAGRCTCRRLVTRPGTPGEYSPVCRGYLRRGA
jgi:transposase-like protein